MIILLWEATQKKVLLISAKPMLLPTLTPSFRGEDVSSSQYFLNNLMWHTYIYIYIGF